MKVQELWQIFADLPADDEVVINRVEDNHVRWYSIDGYEDTEPPHLLLMGEVVFDNGEGDSIP